MHNWFTAAYPGSEEEVPTEFDPEVLQQFLDGACLSLALLIKNPFR